MRSIIISALAALIALTCGATSVTDCQAGQLGNSVTDCSITSLQVSGHIDARDFRFIADSLRHLVSLDLGMTTIDAYQGETLFSNTREYAAGEIPCQSLASMLELTSLVLPYHATVLGNGCLAGCVKLERVELPYDLTRIGDYAFTGCTNLSLVSVPESLSEIGEGAFSHCDALTSVDNLVPPAGVEKQSDTAHSLRIGDRAFACCPSLAGISVSSNWVALGIEAFAESGLEQLELSRQALLDTIPDWAFANTPLRQLTLPAHVVTLGDGALMNVSAIDRLSLPASVNYIGSHAMAYMTGLKELESQPTQVPSLGDSVWYGVEQSKVMLTVSAQSLSDYRAAAQWCNFMTADIQRGDVNADGTVDIADVNIVINIMLGRDSADNYDGRAYITTDSVVDIADVNAVINLMLGILRQQQQAAAQQQQAAAASAQQQAILHATP